MLKKIPLFDLLDILHKIYEEGGDYIDIGGRHTDTRDEIFIGTRDEYYSPIEEEKKLTDEDINKLIT